MSRVFSVLQLITGALCVSVCACVCSVSQLKDAISAQTDISSPDLLFIHCRLCMRDAAVESETVADVFPATSEKFPAVVTSVSMETWRRVTRIKQALRESSCDESSIRHHRHYHHHIVHMVKSLISVQSY